MSDKTVKLSDFPMQTSLADTDTIILDGKRVTFASLLAAIRDGIKVGGRNLLRNSGIKVTNNKYAIALYPYAEAPKVGEMVIVTIWGQLGEGSTKFSAFNGNGDGAFGMVDLVKVSDGKYQGILPIKRDMLRLSVYAMPNVQDKANSTIERIKLERGNIPTDWSPAPEDLLSASGVMLRYSVGCKAKEGGVRHDGYNNPQRHTYTLLTQGGAPRILACADDAERVSVSRILHGHRQHVLSGNICRERKPMHRNFPGLSIILDSRDAGSHSRKESTYHTASDFRSWRCGDKKVVRSVGVLENDDLVARKEVAYV